VIPERVFITGGSSGIGLALSKRLAARGIDLLWASLAGDEISAGRQAVLEVAPAARIEALAIDLSAPHAAQQTLAWLQERGPIDVAVNNAGFGVFGDWTQTDLEDEQRMIALNAGAVHALSRLVLPMLEARAAERGKRAMLINIASNSAFTPLPKLAAYAATKAFVKHYTQGLAQELAAAGSRVTASVVCPAAVRDTPFKHRAGMADVLTFDSFTAVSADEVAADLERVIDTGLAFRVSGWRMRIAYAAMKFMPAPLVRAIAAREVEQRSRLASHGKSGSSD